MVALFLSLACALAPVAAAQAAEPAPQYVFTDGAAAIAIPGAAAGSEVAYSVRTIRADGWGPTGTGRAVLHDGRIAVSPLTEGIHIVSVPGLASEARFLAIDPPPPAAGEVAPRLRRTRQRLLAGAPYLITAMGDSVTATGDYAGLLALLLARATGNAGISVRVHAYPGRSIDATVREFDRDTVERPDLGLLMYGLNDQGGGCSLDGYLEQYRWVAEQLDRRCQADCVFLTPTPDISRDREAAAYGPSMLRTFGFADAVEALAARMDIPCADAFHALWGAGKPTLDATARALWPLYPTGYQEQFRSMLETGGEGDGIHPGVLGHLAIARAACDAILGHRPPQPALACSAVSRWTPEGLVSDVTLRNASAQPRTGDLLVHPVPGGALEPRTALRYDLEPQASTTLTIRWPQVRRPEDLLRHPMEVYAGAHVPLFALFDSCGETGRLQAVRAPFAVDVRFRRARSVVEGGMATAVLLDGDREEAIAVPIPRDAEVGRIPIVRRIERGGAVGWAAAEVAFTRFARARIGEAVVDGDLDEWSGQAEVPIGDPVQARWAGGPADGRTAQEECDPRWRFAAGRDGVYAAATVAGQPWQDRFTLFFDPRGPDLLGTPGRYYWISGGFADERLTLSAGETSPAAPGLVGAVRRDGSGLRLELFVPYALLEIRAWPAAGDLGLSLWWQHRNQDPQAAAPTTNLLWAEDGHPWNPRWYGVVRAGGTEPLPYRVRVK